MYGEKTVRIGFGTVVVSGICWRFWNISPLDQQQTAVFFLWTLSLYFDVLTLVKSSYDPPKIIVCIYH